MIEGGSRIRLVKHAYGLRFGSIEEHSDVVDRRCSTVELDLFGDGCLNVDGELVDLGELTDGGPIDFRVERDAFELVVG